MSYWQVLHGTNGVVGPDAVLHVDLAHSAEHGPVQVQGV